MAISNIAKVTALNVPRMGRRIRRPQHTFQLRTRPYQIAPFMIAPVLPGETMKNLLMQVQAISDPVKNRFLGWWKEYYFFYVKITDLDAREEYQNMVLQGDWDPVAAGVTHNVSRASYYFTASAGFPQIDWLHQCTKRIVEEYFRDEGEAWDVAVFSAPDGSNLPKARETSTKGFWQSARNEADVEFRDVEVDVGPDEKFTMGEFDDARRQFELLRANFAVEMTYEDFLKTYGVRGVEAEKPHRPELLRFVREWTLPVSAIDPTDGSAASAASWKITERADKDRFFKEPGFIVGLTVTRPKVYWSRQTSYGALLMNNVYSWLPALMSDDPNTSLKLVPDLSAPIGDVTDPNGVWIDVKDLLLYGDQFVNFGLAQTDAGMVALPTAAMGKHYVPDADINALFANASPATQIREDGIVTLNIAGRQVDTSS